MAINNSLNINASTPLDLPRGGTSADLTASNGGIVYTSATAMAILAGTATAGQFLTSGSNSAPSWTTATYLPSLVANEILYASATNVLGQITSVNDGVLITSNTGVPSLLANSGTPGFVLTANTGAPPSWQASTGTGTVSSGLINQMTWYAATGTVVSGLATANDGVLVTSGAGVPSIAGALPTAVQTNITELGTITTGVWHGSVLLGQYGGTGVANTGLTINLGSPTTGYVLTSDSSGNASWAANPGTGSIITLNGNSGSATASGGVITISGGTTGLTTSGASNTLSLTGTLAIANGGTGVTSVTNAQTASAWAGWDANGNLSANNVVNEYATTTQAGGTTTLTVASSKLQYFPGSSGQTVLLPVVSTLALGHTFYITAPKNSLGTLSIKSSGSNAIISLSGDQTAVLTCISLSGTTAASWNYTLLTSGAIGVINLGNLNSLAYYSSNPLGNTLSAIATANSAVLVTNSTGVPSWSGTMTNGQLIIGSTGDAPVAATITPGTGISVTNAAGAITIATTSFSIAWSGVSGTTQAAAINSGYVIQNAAQTTVTLPATAPIGSVVSVRGLGTAGWILAANTGQTIKVIGSTTSSGGSLTSAESYDSIDVTCVTADTTWIASSVLSTGLTVA